MKHLGTLLLALLPLLCFAQSEPPRDESGKIIYQEVVPMEAAQKELYARALVAIPKDAKEVVREEPSAVGWKDEKEMLIQGETIRVPVKLKYAVVLQEKDGRYMYAITDLLLEDKKIKGFVPLEQASVYQPIPQKHYFKTGALRPLGLAIQRLNTAHQVEIDKAIVDVVENIKRTMASPTGDDW